MFHSIARRFTPLDLVSMVPGLGLVIDLTFTNKYYFREEIENCGIQYEKIFCEGKRVPSIEAQQRFFSAVDRFLQENSANDKLIGVHCTHGVNRTGYLICKYLIERYGRVPHQAIQEFSSARGYVIEECEYLQDLSRCYPLRPNRSLHYDTLACLMLPPSSLPNAPPPSPRPRPKGLGIRRFHGTRHVGKPESERPPQREEEEEEEEEEESFRSDADEQDENSGGAAVAAAAAAVHHQASQKNFRKFYNVDFRKVPHVYSANWAHLDYQWPPVTAAIKPAASRLLRPATAQACQQRHSFSEKYNSWYNG